MWWRSKRSDEHNDGLFGQAKADTGAGLVRKPRGRFSGGLPVGNGVGGQAGVESAGIPAGGVEVDHRAGGVRGVQLVAGASGDNGRGHRAGMAVPAGEGGLPVSEEQHLHGGMRMGVGRAEPSGEGQSAGPQARRHLPGRLGW